MVLKWSLCFLLTILVNISVQQCTIENFEEEVALNLLDTTEPTNNRQTFTIDRIFYNCLSTSQMIGIYRSMSVSMLYVRSDSPTTIRDVRYTMTCLDNAWIRNRTLPTALQNIETKRNCSDCTNESVNDYHCTR